MNTSDRTLPARDLGFAAYPERIDMPSAWRTWVQSYWPQRTSASLPVAMQRALAGARQRLRALDDATLALLLPRLRERLRKAELRGAVAGYALGFVAELARRRLGMAPYDTQLQAAWLMLEGTLAEMATGEGKTLAAGLAAATAALAGVPVHLLTANDYLVQRDREKLSPLYEALGLSSACVLPTMTRAAREAAYRSDIVHLSARELAFDYLRDHLLLAGERDPRALRALSIDGEGTLGAAPSPVLPGLCLAIVDEADSILLDEATVPLILAAPADAVQVQSYRRAMVLARTLRRGRDYTLDAARRCAALNDRGRAQIGAAVAGEAGLLRPARRAHELVEAALSAQHALRRDRDYAVIEGRLQLIDDITGRIAEGRQWTGALQAMVEIKEGLEPSPSTRVAAQITYQRFFPRYLRMGGMSGTLLEAGRELRATYGSAVTRVPLAKPDRRRWLGETLYADTAARDDAIVARVKRCVALGRPVLVGTDSVAASVRVSARLHAAGVANQVLNAVQDADEAERIARAGQAGVVTVATNIAGRGTDIRLDDRARAAGGLHVIAAMRNRARRIDRQLIGRAARHGDPGSAERLLALDDALLADAWPPALRRIAARLARQGVVPRWLAGPLAAGAQRRCEWRERAQRAQLAMADRRADELFGFAGGTE